MVHFQDATLTGRAMMSAVRLLCLALFAEPDIACRGFHCERRVLRIPSFLRWQMTVAIVQVQRRAGIGEDGGRVAPIEHEVEEDAEDRGECT